jgi:ferrous iron transport protein A
MIALGELETGMIARVVSVDGGGRFLGRIAAMGIVPGSIVEMVLQQKKHPLLVFVRDSIIAINRSDCEKIGVEMIGKNR